MKIHGRRLGAYDQVKEARLRRLQTMGSQQKGLNQHGAGGSREYSCHPCHCTSVPTQRLSNTTSEPEHDPQTRADVAYPRRLTSCNSWTVWCGC